VSGDAPVTFLWDFFGPSAAGTATHFEKHLREFLGKNALEGCTTGTESEGEGHMAAYCITPPPARDAVGRARRPQRPRGAPPPPGRAPRRPGPPRGPPPPSRSCPRAARRRREPPPQP